MNLSVPRFLALGLLLVEWFLPALCAPAFSAPTTPPPLPSSFSSSTSTWKVARRRKRRRRRKRKKRKLVAGDTININTASRTELMRLPRVGPKMADKIISYRQQYGAFQRLEQLRNVRGIGHRTLQKWRPFLIVGGKVQKSVTKRSYDYKRKFHGKKKRRSRRSRYAKSVFISSRNGKIVMRYGTSRSGRGNCFQRWFRKAKWKKGYRINVNTASATTLRKLPCIGKKRARAIVVMRRADGSYKSLKDLTRVNGISKRTTLWLKNYVRFKINLNTATLEELESLPALASGLGEAIIKHRKRYGAFRNLRSLLRIRGLGRATLHRLKDLVEVKGGTLRARQTRRYKRKVSRRSQKRKVRGKRSRKKRKNSHPRKRTVKKKGLPNIEVTDID